MLRSLLLLPLPLPLPCVSALFRKARAFYFIFLFHFIAYDKVVFAFSSSFALCCCFRDVRLWGTAWDERWGENGGGRTVEERKINKCTLGMSRCGGGRRRSSRAKATNERWARYCLCLAFIWFDIIVVDYKKQTVVIVSLLLPHIILSSPPMILDTLSKRFLSLDFIAQCRRYCYLLLSHQPHSIVRNLIRALKQALRQTQTCRGRIFMSQNYRSVGKNTCRNANILYVPWS